MEKAAEFVKAKDLRAGMEVIHRNTRHEDRYEKVRKIGLCSDRSNIHINGSCYFGEATVEIRKKG